MAQGTADSAVEKDNLIIPVLNSLDIASPNILILPQLIDFSQFLHGDASSKTTAASQILLGFQKAGFIYLKNHGIAPDTVKSMFAQSAGFFARPQEQKDALEWYSPEANRGYTAHGREKVSQLDSRDDVEALRLAAPDLKESLEIGRDDEEGLPNMWPSTEDEEGKAFKKTSVAFFEECKHLHMEVMRAIAVGLGIDEGWFDGYTDRGDNTLRLLHYPPARKEVFEKNKLQVRAGEHTDYGAYVSYNISSCNSRRESDIEYCRLYNAPVPRLPRRFTSRISQRLVCRRNANPRYYCSQRRGPSYSMVK